MAILKSYFQVNTPILFKQSGNGILDRRRDAWNEDITRSERWRWRIEIKFTGNHKFHVNRLPWLARHQLMLHLIINDFV